MYVKTVQLSVDILESIQHFECTLAFAMDEATKVSRTLVQIHDILNSCRANNKMETFFIFPMSNNSENKTYRKQLL